jgi:8-oxo-dGTP pyrophosphatase MutT (NUDIX family)
MLVRPAASLEVFMLRRSQASHFVPDAYVFPGGTLSDGDLSERALARTHVDPQAVKQQFRAQPAPGLSPVPLASTREAEGLLFAALRELYEEAGVLLACDASGGAARIDPGEPRTDYLELLENRDLFADTNALALFSQWLTPPQFPKRYNTHFFLARASADAVAAADAHETHDGLWIAPADALARAAAGDLHLVYPTVKHLQRLARFTDCEQLFEFARTKPILAITPNTVGDGFALPPELEDAW